MIPHGFLKKMSTVVLSLSGLPWMEPLLFGSFCKNFTFPIGTDSSPDPKFGR